MSKANIQISEWLDRNLASISKPARYLGNEFGAIRKDPEGVGAKIVFAFPDVYEVGMSHLGIKILYHIVNKEPGLVAERVFAPWVDMEAAMRSDGIPLFSLESRTPLADFDAIGFTLQYELSYTNIINMLDMSGIPVHSRDRVKTDPIVVGGGPVAYNPEPLADFFDCFLIGDGEESIIEFMDIVREWRKGAYPRTWVLERLATLAGCYVPSMYNISYNSDETVKAVEPKYETVPKVVLKRIVKDLNDADFPDTIPVPYMDIVHDRIMLEVLRGCGRGCRFCQAGMIYRPVRERSSEGICDLASRLIENTGYEELSLSSLSTADHSRVEEFFTDLVNNHSSKRVSVSLPSLRADAFSMHLANLAQSVRKTGLTFAPEAGTQRLRDVINKGVTEEDLLKTVASAFSSGWDQVKLYFMIGLPTETDEDIAGIAELAKKALYTAKDAKRASGRGGAVDIGVSVSSFVPKPHTPFQWFPQNSIEELDRKQKLLASTVRGRGLSLNWHDAKTSRLEAIFSRGDRRLADVIYAAWSRGCKFDGWEEHFRYDTWISVIKETGYNPDFYASRERGRDEIMPWDHISSGVSRRFLWSEWEKALDAALTEDCRSGRCSGCGVCGSLNASVRVSGGRVSNAEV